MDTEQISEWTTSAADAAIDQAKVMAQSIYDMDERQGAPLFVMINCTEALCSELGRLNQTIRDQDR